MQLLEGSQWVERRGQVAGSGCSILSHLSFLSSSSFTCIHPLFVHFLSLSLFVTLFLSTRCPRLLQSTTIYNSRMARPFENRFLERSLENRARASRWGNYERDSRAGMFTRRQLRWSFEFKNRWSAIGWKYLVRFGECRWRVCFWSKTVIYEFQYMNFRVDYDLSAGRFCTAAVIPKIEFLNSGSVFRSVDGAKMDFWRCFGPRFEKRRKNLYTSRSKTVICKCNIAQMERVPFIVHGRKCTVAHQRDIELYFRILFRNKSTVLFYNNNQ